MQDTNAQMKSSAAGDARTSEQGQQSLPVSIVVPNIKGEMQQMRPATVDDIEEMERIGAFSAASVVSGRSSKAEKSIVAAWVRDSMAWQRGTVDMEAVFAANGYTRTMAWTLTIQPDEGANESSGPASADSANQAVVAQSSEGQRGTQPRIIGMIFLHTIDARSHSAQIQVILGRDYRDRGYSRDSMPRVMTYGFAPAPTGLGLHRISVSVPEKNARTLSVYQFLGFTQEGLFRDALWDSENSKYQDRYLLATLADEYDPVRSLDAFGMRIIADNPGVKEALAAHQHSVEIEQAVRSSAAGDLPASGIGTPAPGEGRPALSGAESEKTPSRETQQQRQQAQIQSQSLADQLSSLEQSAGLRADPVQTMTGGTGMDDEQSMQWSDAGSKKTTTSKRAWWRRFGKSRKRESAKDAASAKNAAADSDAAAANAPSANATSANATANAGVTSATDAAVTSTPTAAEKGVSK